MNRRSFVAALLSLPFFGLVNKFDSLYKSESFSMNNIDSADIHQRLIKAQYPIDKIVVNSKPRPLIAKYTVETAEDLINIPNIIPDGWLIDENEHRYAYRFKVKFHFNQWKKTRIKDLKMEKI